MRAAFVIALLVSGEALALDPSIRPSQYVHESWDMSDGLPASSLFEVEADDDGFIWFGTEEGSGWFDGERFVYRDARTAPELSPFVMDIVPLGDGRACFVLQPSHPDSMACYSADGSTERIPSDAIRVPSEGNYEQIEALRDRDGTIWIADDRSGLFRMENGRMRRVLDRTVRAVEPAAQGGVWVGGTASIFRADASGIVEEYALPPGGVAAVTSLSVGREAIWAVAAGLFVLRGGKVIAVPLPGIAGVPLVVKEDRDGNVWLGTTAGLIRIRNGVLARFPESHPLARARVYDLDEDRDGSLWIAALPTGLHRLRSGSFIPIGASEGLRQGTIWTLAEERDGTILIGGDGGLHRFKDREVRESFGKAEGLPSDVVRDVVVDHDGTIWVAPKERSKLGRIRGNRAETVDLAAALAPSDVRSEILNVAVDGVGDLWVGGAGSILLQMREGRHVKTWTTSDELVENIYSLGTLRDGAIWGAGGEFGMSFIRQAGVRSVLAPTTGSRGSIDGALEADDRLWLMASVAGHEGVAILEGDRLVPVSTLPNVRLHALVDDGLGNLWASSNVGIYRFSRADAVSSLTSGKPVPVRWFGREDGMRTEECNGSRHSGLRATDGKLWFATATGAVWVDPATIEIDPTPPAVRIVETRVEGLRVSPLSLAAGTRRFEIDYTAAVMRAPKKARFRYMLEGFDPDWVDAGNRRTAYYTNVPGGNYRFRVIAANESGIWNQAGATTELRIALLFRETSSFLAVCVFALVATMAGLVGLRSRQLRRRSTELQRQVDDATKLLAARVDEKLARTGQIARFGEFAASVAHNLKTPLTFLRGEIELLDEKRRAGAVPATELESSLRALLDQVRRMNAEIETGMSFVRPGAAPIVEVDLAALAREIALLLRSRATASSVRIDIAIDGELRVRGNLDNLRHAIANLVGNAIDAMPGGGTVTISGERAGARVELRVADTGPGIPEAVRAKLFRPFVSTKGEQGTGLGLASCRRIVEEEHAGKIRLEPSTAGAVFVLELPA